MTDDRNELSKMLRQQRVMMSLTLAELAEKSGVSSSHLGRIERGERFPSGRTLRKLAKPLGFEETELFTLANYLSPQISTVADTAAIVGDWTLMWLRYCQKSRWRYSVLLSQCLTF